MKTRKILALVMAIAILAVSMTVVASATEEVPASAYQIHTKPTKPTSDNPYTDADCFDPTGLVISDGSTNISYDTDEQYFTFMINGQEYKEDQPLTVYVTEVEVLYKGESCGFVDIAVGHKGSDKKIPINNTHHGEICEVCGLTCKNEVHTVEYWTPNGDASLIMDETESGECSVCGDRVSRYIPGTATYITAFAEVDILVTILGLVSSIVQGFALI